MPPEAITLHTYQTLALVSPSQRQWLSRPHTSGDRMYVGYTLGSGSSSKSRPPVKAGSDDSQTASSSSSTSLSPGTTRMSSAKRRKSTVLDMSLLLPAAGHNTSKRYISLKPKTGTIIQRCVAPPGSSSGSTTPPASKTTTAGATKKKLQAAAASSVAASTNRWSRATDLGNSRSNVPSPREVERAKVKEQERIKARVEAAAQKKAKKATAAAAVGRRRGSHGKSTRVHSPQDKDEAVAPPTITTTSADGAKDQAVPSGSAPPYPPRIGLKRTRSVGAGVTAISTSLANSLGAGGAPAVSSPLKAVTGPNTPEDNEGEGQQRKRSRLSDPTDDVSASAPVSAVVGAEAMKRKASSHSPPTRTSDLDGTTTTSVPNTVPTATLPLPLKGDSVEMRRAASTSNLDSTGSRPSRRSSFGVEARERSKREVTLPGRLRDYDVRSTTPA